MLDVLSLAELDTKLKKKSAHEYAGPCPDTSCRCQTNGFSVRWSEYTDANGKTHGNWRFMCRGCWDSQEYMPNRERKRGWGDAIDYLRHYKGMSFRLAKEFLGDEAPSDEAHRPPPPKKKSGTPDWQGHIDVVVQTTTTMMWNDSDPTGLRYVRSRGLRDDIIRKAKLGYAMVDAVPHLYIPSVNDGLYTTVMRRNLAPGVQTRWKDIDGGTKSELYLADALKRKKPTILCEDAFSALSIVQEVGDRVNVVATCGATSAQEAKWLARLARMPLVLVALDADEAGDENAQWWIDRLPNSRRLRPLLKDANDMLMAGYDLQEWIEQAIPIIETSKSEPIPDGNNVTITSLYEQFLHITDQIGKSVFGEGCTITLLPKNYTLVQRVADLEEAQREQYRQMEREKWARDRAKRAKPKPMSWTRQQVRKYDKDADPEHARELEAESEDR